MLERRHPPSGGAAFFKAHGLGNDYLVFEEGEEWLLDGAAIRSVCHRWKGVGSDGVVLLLADRTDGIFRLRMFNPDGSEFERSGNGLRILGAYLSRSGLVGEGPFRVHVGGDGVDLTVHGRTGPVYDVSVAMGRAEIGPAAVSMDPSVLDGQGRFPGPSGEPLDIVPVSVGNPHLVVLTDRPRQDELERIGPYLCGHPSLAHGANVQLAGVEAPGTCHALIWERGVGRTSASGTSSCAVAVAAVHRGLVPAGEVTVRMEGGELSVTVDQGNEVSLRGPVEAVHEGRLLGAALGRGE
jgi:diaminopimelate epimerase